MHFGFGMRLDLTILARFQPLCLCSSRTNAKLGDNALPIICE